MNPRDQEIPTYSVLDIETHGGRFSQLPKGFHLLVAGIKYKEGYSFYANTDSQLLRLAGFLRDFDGVLVTYNGNRFDLPILREHFRGVGIGMPLIRVHYDILDVITKMTGYRMSLSILASEVLNRTSKPWNHGKNLRIWQREPDRLVQHNREDLDITEEIYKLILSGKPLMIRGRSLKLTVRYGSGPHPPAPLLLSRQGDARFCSSHAESIP